MPCGGPKKFPRTSSIVKIIFSFSNWSFEISEDILINQKIIIGLDSFSNLPLIYLAPFGLYMSLKMQNYCYSLWLHVAKSIGSLKRR